jgi:hypothetical protein
MTKILLEDDQEILWVYLTMKFHEKETLTKIFVLSFQVCNHSSKKGCRKRVRPRIRSVQRATG